MPRPPTSRQATGPTRPMSLSVFGPSSSSGSIPSIGRMSGKGLGITIGEQPEAFIQWLGMYKGTNLDMEVSRCKKLRMLLRHESTTWVRRFLELGGYKLVLQRLQEVLDVEWRYALFTCTRMLRLICDREEQHDDQMLYELLRCIKALSTSEASSIPL